MRRPLLVLALSICCALSVTHAQELQIPVDDGRKQSDSSFSHSVAETGIQILKGAQKDGTFFQPSSVGKVTI